MRLGSLQNSSRDLCLGLHCAMHLCLQISHRAWNNAVAPQETCNLSVDLALLGPAQCHHLKPPSPKPRGDKNNSVSFLRSAPSTHKKKNRAASPAHSSLIRIITCFSLNSDLATFSEISKLPDVVWFLLGCRFSQSMWLCHETSQFTIQILHRTKIRSFTSVSLG